MTVEDESYETEFIVTDIDGNYSYTDRSGRTFTGTTNSACEKLHQVEIGRVQVFCEELHSEFYNELAELYYLYWELAELAELYELDDLYKELYELYDEFDERDELDEFYAELYYLYEELAEFYELAELYEFDGYSFTVYSPTEFVNRLVDGKLVTEDGSYIERDGRYWREVSRERLVESQPRFSFIIHYLLLIQNTMMMVV